MPEIHHDDKNGVVKDFRSESFIFMKMRVDGRLYRRLKGTASSNAGDYLRRERVERFPEWR